MSKFQALYVYYLRERCECTWRALAAHYYNRYTEEGKLISPKDRTEFEMFTVGGNQIDGMLLCRDASDILGIKVD